VLQYSAQPRMALEMCFVKAVQASDIVPVSTLLSRLDLLIAGQPKEVIQEKQTRQESTPPDAAPVVSDEPEQEIKVETVPAPATLQGDERDAGPLKSEVGPGKNQEWAVGQDLKQQAAALTQPAPKDIVKEWDGFLEHVRDRKKWMGSTLGLAEKVVERDGQLIIKFDEQSECLYLQDAANMKLLVEFAQDFFQKELAVKIEVAGLGGGSEVGEGQPQEERRALANDPRVQLTVEVLGGQVAGIRTGPRSR